MEPVNGSASVPTPLKGPNNLLRNLLSSQRKIESRVDFVQRAFEQGRVQSDDIKQHLAEQFGDAAAGRVVSEEGRVDFDAFRNLLETRRNDALTEAIEDRFGEDAAEGLIREDGTVDLDALRDLFRDAFGRERAVAGAFFDLTRPEAAINRTLAHIREALASGRLDSDRLLANLAERFGAERAGDVVRGDGEVDFQRLRNLLAADRNDALAERLEQAFGDGAADGIIGDNGRIDFGALRDLIRDNFGSERRGTIIEETA